MRDFLFVASNTAITLGYVFLAVFVVPKVKVHLWMTKVGAIGFFVLCGMHHLENVAHVLFEADEPVRQVMLSGHMLAIDLPQAVFVWLFVVGLYIEIVRWGRWDTLAPGLGDRPGE